MSELQVVARLEIQDGKLSEFNDVAAKCMKSVREKDTGTLRYDWFINEAQNQCVVLETYRDSPAVFEHIGNLGETLGELLSVAEMALDVFGEPSADLVSALSDLGAGVYTPFQTK